MSAVRYQEAFVQKPVSQNPVIKRERRKQPLRQSVRATLDLYFQDLDGHEAKNVYQMVMGEVELAMLESLMEHVQGHQTRAAKVLGINRNTLRKKLEHYGLI